VTSDWQVLVPLKSLVEAKTRIGATQQVRADLALAMCRDVVSAALGSSRVARVHVITQDRRVADALATTAARAWSVPRRRGLNEELTAAMGTVRRRHGVVALMGDLPCLTSELFTEILQTAPRETASFITDMGGHGTTVLINPPGVRRVPKFGIGSALAHRGYAMTLTGDRTWIPARRDVDTLDDLAHAMRVGCGPVTAALCRAKRLGVIPSGQQREPLVGASIGADGNRVSFGL
jgi:2-phospho-L-lactate/phosphoenolpyruvate guanylyltransferase